MQPREVLRPGTLMRLARLWPHARRQGRDIGQLYRVGYYRRSGGLDCIWLVDADGRYKWTADHAFVARHFEILRRSGERSFYGAKRAQLGPLTSEDVAFFSSCRADIG